MALKEGIVFSPSLLHGESRACMDSLGGATNWSLIRGGVAVILTAGFMKGQVRRSSVVLWALAVALTALSSCFSEELSEDKIKFAVDEFGGLRVVGACWRVLSSVITKPGQFAANRLRSAAMDRVELASRASSLPGSGGPAAKRPRVS